MLQLSKRRIRSLWEWFSEFADTLYALPQLPQEATEEIEKRVKKINRKLSWQVTEKPEEDKKQLIISANRHKEIFPLVEEIVSTAPQLKNWEVVAFRQRLYPIPPAETEVITLNPKDIYFSYLIQEDKNLGLKIYLKEQIISPEIFLKPVVLLLEYALGEYDATMNLGDFQFKTLPENYKMLNLFNFTDLPQIFDNVFHNYTGRQHEV